MLNVESHGLPESSFRKPNKQAGADFGTVETLPQAAAPSATPPLRKAAAAQHAWAVLGCEDARAARAGRVASGGLAGHKGGRALPGCPQQGLSWPPQQAQRTLPWST